MLSIQDDFPCDLMAHTYCLPDSEEQVRESHLLHVCRLCFASLLLVIADTRSPRASRSACFWQARIEPSRDGSNGQGREKSPGASYHPRFLHLDSPCSFVMASLLQRAPTSSPPFEDKKIKICCVFVKKDKKQLRFSERALVSAESSLQ